MLKKDFIKIVKTNLDKRNVQIKDMNKINLLITTFLNTISENLEKGEVINFLGFGKFEVIERAAKIGRNPKTGETIQIKARKIVKFKAGKELAKKISSKD